jgi:Carbonic anhydrase
MNQFVRESLSGNAEHADQFHTRFDDVQESQAPRAVTVCCSDSRVLQDAMWDNTEPGTLFTCGNIGNRVIQHTDDGAVVSGDVLYPLAHTGTETVVVVGHTGCGAVTAAYEDLINELNEPAGIEHCLGLLKPHLTPGIERLSDHLSREAEINRPVEYNVDRQVDHLRASEDIPDAVAAVGVVYDLKDQYDGNRCEIHFINVEGETDVDALRAAYPEIESRTEWLWEY